MSKEIVAGNLLDMLMDQKEDRLNGHKALGIVDKLRLGYSTLDASLDFIKDPMTDMEDVLYMIRKLLKHYIFKPIITSASSQLSHLGAT